MRSTPWMWLSGLPVRNVRRACLTAKVVRSASRQTLIGHARRLNLALPREVAGRRTPADSRAHSRRRPRRPARARSQRPRAAHRTQPSRSPDPPRYHQCGRRAARRRRTLGLGGGCRCNLPACGTRRAARGVRRIGALRRAEPSGRHGQRHCRAGHRRATAAPQYPPRRRPSWCGARLGGQGAPRRRGADRPVHAASALRRDHD